MAELLKKSDVDKNPFNQFKKWYNELLQSSVSEPSAMTLAPSSKDGIPSSRTVLLKGFDENGFLFFTNYESNKGKNLIENPFAELLFYWMDLQRQVRISGKVEKTSREVSEIYFNSRPLKSRIGAWASKQSKEIPNREFLEKQFDEFAEKFKVDVPLPPNWGGFRLIPERFEFWQGRESRLHDRICYKKKKDDWEIVRLAP
ncbi:MAG TPA: pyridoxamine 5'-phosphate oxidase [Ignavibacteriaceae bacterium]|nr:pyridoxamine 5'-phosphate oxidase [Ignavibacteriaceae bacterium]